MRRGGFTLVECLMGMALSLFIIASGLESFVLAQRAFSRLKAAEEASQAALAAIDKMKIDLLHAGRGLAEEMRLGLIEAVRMADGELRTTALERSLTLAGEARAGDVRLVLESVSDAASGQTISLHDGPAAEVRTIARVEPGALVLAEPLENGYAPATAAVSLLESVAYFFEAPRRVLRRRVNGGSAQPLLEDAASAAWSYDPGVRLVRIRLEADAEGAHPHEATVFLKNPALAGKTGA